MNQPFRRLMIRFLPGVVAALVAGPASTAAAEKIYVLDRGFPNSKLLRANLDGTDPETLAFGSSIIGLNLFGFAVDPSAGKMYWIGDPGGGAFRILRANLEIPEGESAGTRTDVETVVTLTTSPSTS